MLFPGLIFLLLDIRITVGTAVIGLLPDFAGFWLVQKALERRQDPWRHPAFGLALLSGVLFVTDLVDKTAMAQFWCQAGWLLSEVGMLVLLRHLIREEKQLRLLFPVVACIRVLRCLVGWIPVLGTACGVADTVVAVCFLAAAWKSLTRRRG